MKVLIEIILFTLLYLPSYSQSTKYKRDSLGKLINKPLSEITKDNHEAYFERAKNLIAFDIRDSLILAHDIFYKLNYFDNNIYSAKRVKKYVNTIIAKNLSYCKKNILGAWDFAWTGTNWGTSSKIDSFLNSQIIFSNNEVLFYMSDTLVRKSKYKITSVIDYPFPNISIYQLVFLDDNTSWDFRFTTSGSRYFANITFSEENIGLCINEMPNCVCGCPERIYIKRKLPTFTSQK